jgi:hypothetical protein
MTENNIISLNASTCGSIHLPPAFNIPWAIASALCLWFLFIHAPVVLLSQDHIKPLLYVHLIGAYSIYLVCLHNTLFTPSTLGGAARPFHIWAGRIGLLLGVMGFYTGFVLTWFILEPAQNLGFSIGITYGGIAQMQVQFLGYRAIRRFQKVKAKIEAGEFENQRELLSLEDEQDQHLAIHITSMINLFVLACGIPALIRLGEAIGNIVLLPSIIILYSVSYFMARPIMEKMRTKRASERGVGDSEDAELTRYNFSSHYQNITTLS